MGLGFLRIMRSWPRLRRRTARSRLTSLYGGVFLLSGVALVATTYVLFERATSFRTPSIPQIPHDPAIKNLALPALLTQRLPTQVKVLYQMVTRAKGTSVPTSGQGSLPIQRVHMLTADQQALTHDQHQLARTVHQLAQSVHQLAQAGTVQAAQRATDSHQLLVNSGVALAIVAVLAFLAGWLIAGRMLRAHPDHYPHGPADLLHQLE